MEGAATNVPRPWRREIRCSRSSSSSAWRSVISVTPKLFASLRCLTHRASGRGRLAGFRELRHLPKLTGDPREQAPLREEDHQQLAEEDARRGEDHTGQNEQRRREDAGIPRRVLEAGPAPVEEQRSRAGGE